MPNPAKPYVFISHSSDDNEQTAEIAGYLQQADIDVWVDLENLQDGMEWLQEIQKGLDNASATVVVMSRNARSSKWVERETLLTLNLGLPLFIAQIEKVPLPIHLVDLQYTNCYRDKEKGYAKLAKAVKKALQKNKSPKPVEDVTLIPTEDNFFDYLTQVENGEQLSLIAKDLYQWSTKNADEVEFGGKHTPGFHARVLLGDEFITVFSLWAYMRKPAVQIPFDYLLDKSPYDKKRVRQSTLKTLNRIMPDDNPFHADRADRRPSIPLKQFVNRADNLEIFKDTIAEMMDNLRSG